MRKLLLLILLVTYCQSQDDWLSPNWFKSVREPKISCVKPSLVPTGAQPDGSVFYSNPMNFTWTIIISATSYYIIINSEGGSDSLYSETNSYNGYVTTANYNYNYTIISVNTCGYTTSGAQVFTFQAGDVPTALGNLDPSGATGFPRIGGSFMWDAITPTSDEQITYEIQIASDEYFEFIAESASGLLTAEYTGMNFLEPITLYYWRVRAVNQMGAGNWSTGTFTTRI